MAWTPGDVSGLQTLTAADHLYAQHINELRTASDSKVVTGSPNTWTSAQTFNAGTLLDKGNLVFDARAYGVVADGKMVTDSAMTSGSPIITSATAGFTAGDVGKGVMVTGAGDAGGNVAHMLNNVTISSYQSATQVTLSANATHTVSGATLWYGTDNHTFINNALTAATGLGYVLLQAGNIFLNSNNITIPANTGLQGHGREITSLIGGGVNSDSNYQWVSDLTIDTNNHFFFDNIHVAGNNNIYERIHFKNWGNFGLDLRPGATNIQVRDCAFDHNGVNSVTGGSFILTGGWNNVHVDNCTFGDNNNGGCFMEVYDDATALSNNTYLWFTNNKVTGKFSKAGYALGKHIYFNNNVFACDVQFTSAIDQSSGFGTFTTDDVHFSNNTLLTNANNGNRTEVNLCPSGVSNGGTHDSGILSNIWITNNKFEFGQVELTINNPPGGNFINNLHIENNEFTHADAAALNFTTGKPLTFDSLNVSGNNFMIWKSASGWPALNFNPNGASAVTTLIRCRITNNVFANGAGKAVYLQQSNGGVISGTAEVAVMNNDAVGCTIQDDSGAAFGSVVNNRGTNPLVAFAAGNVTGAATFTRVNGHEQTATLTGNITVTLTSGLFKGDMLTLILTQDGAGNHTVTWPANFKKAGGTLTLSTGVNAVDMVTMVWDGSNWREISRALNVS